MHAPALWHMGGNLNSLAPCYCGLDRLCLHLLQTENRLIYNCHGSAHLVKGILHPCWLLFPSAKSLAGRPLWILPDRLRVRMALHALGHTGYVHSVKEKRPGKDCGHWSHD